MSLKALKQQIQKVGRIKSAEARHENADIASLNVSFDQKYYPSGSLFHVCEQRILPNGDLLTEKLHLLLLTDALALLENYHTLGIVHGNLKKGNIKVKFSKRLGRYTVKLSEQSYAPAYTLLSEDVYSLGNAFSLAEGIHAEPQQHTKLWGLWKMTLHDHSLRFQTAQEARQFFIDL